LPMGSVHFLIINMHNFASSHQLGDLSRDAFLGRLDTTIDSENVRVHLGVLNYYSTHEFSQVNNVNGRDHVVTLANDGQSSGALNPSLLEVVVQDHFTVTIADTSAEDMNSKQRLSGH